MSEQLVVVDQLKQITSTLSNLVGADSTADMRQLTTVDMDRYLNLSQSFSDRSRQLDAVYRQANDVKPFFLLVCLCHFVAIENCNDVLSASAVVITVSGSSLQFR